MLLGRILIAALFFIIAGLAWFIWPFYGFYAHQGEAPFPPWGWIEFEGADAPAMQDVLDENYAVAGEKVLAAMKEHRQTIGAPAMTAAVSVEGEVVWQGAVGWADIRKKKQATPNTILRIGSTSKAVTATALARLVDRDVIDLDAPISTYMDDLPNPEWKTITPRMLASHMAGVPHYGDNQDTAGKLKTGTLKHHYADVRDALEIFDESPLLFPPGENFEYSSLGTVLLGAVMSEAAGKPYRQIIQEEVVEPAGTTSMIVAPMRAGANENLATFYYIDGDRYREWRPIDLSHRLPGGGWAASSADLVRIGALQFDENFISTKTRTEFWTPQKLNSGEVNEQDYAIGWRWREWEVDGVGLARNANHGGVSRGAQSWLLVFPDYEMAIAFNINSKTDEFSEFGGFYQTIFREFALAKNQTQ
ncbi:serine hydrolase [Hyphococcus flavus]|uniref:Serine hydrolase n=1 Tax=Hyphococcus flavus TaxID=1866326 RepID=A0AAE9ZCI7_9PROT|nr:serine hydrolase domain-containing protein [Hyphococcus flavus]WDI32239.1 serine hydrolase [Hyphococcus flavus]